MITQKMRNFVDQVLDAGQLTDAHVQLLARDILADGAASHEAVDVLVSLDRSVPVAATGWTDYLVATVAGYVVWTCRPTGRVTRDLAQWLMTSLSIGDGPTENARRIAFEVVREAEACDDQLVLFALGRGVIPPARQPGDLDAVLRVA